VCERLDEACQFNLQASLKWNIANLKKWQIPEDLRIFFIDLEYCKSEKVADPSILALFSYFQHSIIKCSEKACTLSWHFLAR
jgi:hypothetical protein